VAFLANNASGGILDDEFGPSLLSQLAPALHRCGTLIVQGIGATGALDLYGPAPAWTGFD
jgi:hypothetical protein